MHWYIHENHEITNLRRLAATDRSVDVDAIEYRQSLTTVLDLELGALQLHLAGV
jgi:hypothetical protein